MTRPQARLMDLGEWSRYTTARTDGSNLHRGQISADAYIVRTARKRALPSTTR